MTYVAWLDGREDVTPTIVGGKGASLARLARAGHPVPPGFALTAAAYRSFHGACGLDAAMDGLATLQGRPTMAVVKEACAPLAAALGDHGLPAEAEHALAAAFAELEATAGPGATFAVRSSGLSEDSAGASFAGLYESYLNLRSFTAVRDAVLKCYRCLWQPRAVHYRTLKGIDHSKEAMAVVVMQTVASAVSGVAFSLNPVTGARDEVIINASWGFGEAVVSGFVSPDNYVALKDGTLARKDVFEKHIRIVPTEEGTAQEPVPAELANEAALSDDQVAHVAKTTAAIEAQYGCPIDIEFAYDARGRFYLLQARPITTH